MSPPSSPARVPKPAKRHRRITTKQSSRKTAKISANRAQLETIDDWHQHDVSGWMAPSRPPQDPLQLKVWEQQGRIDRLRDLIPFWRDGVLAALKGEEVAKLGDFLQRLEEEEQSESWQAKNGGWGDDYGEDVWGAASARGDDWEATPAGAGEGWGSHSSRDWVRNHPWVSPELEWHEWGTSPTINRGWGPIPSTNYGWGEKPDETGWGVPEDASTGGNARADGGGFHSEDTSPELSAASPRKQHDGKIVVETSRDSWAFVEEVARQEDASHEKRRSMHEFYAMPTQDKLKKIQEVVAYLRATA